MKMMRVTRTIVLEGSAEWVRKTLSQSWLPDENEGLFVGKGNKAKCSSRTDELWEDEDE